jgi:hypothetical protein
MKEAVIVITTIELLLVLYGLFSSNDLKGIHHLNPFWVLSTFNMRW